MTNEEQIIVENFLAEHLPGGLPYFRKNKDMDMTSDDLGRIILAALHRPPQKVVAYYVKGIGAFYIKYDSISEKDKQLGLVALGEIDV